MNNRNNSECFVDSMREPSFRLLGRSLKGSTTWEPAEGEQNIVLTIFIKFLLTVLPFVIFCTYLINSFTVVSKILLFPVLLGRAENAFVGKLEFLFNLLAIMWAGFEKFLSISRGFFFGVCVGFPSEYWVN